MKRQTAFIFYALSIYVIFQFGWWSFLLMSLTEQLNPADGFLQKKALMVLGEGLVFFLILIIGFWKIHNSIKKELALGKRQQNFVLSVTHELKTPLAGIKLYLQTLKKRDLEKTKQEELLNRALEENNRLENLVENILTVARIDDKSYSFISENVNALTFVKAVVKRYEIFEELAFTLEIQSDLTIDIDTSVMDIVLTNLIDNSMKYAGNKAHIQISVNKINNFIEWVVEDNGPGIEKEKFEEIFQKFVRLENEDTRKAKGTGLGLYIVDQFVRLQNGKVIASTSTLGGLKITIVL